MAAWHRLLTFGDVVVDVFGDWVRDPADKFNTVLTHERIRVTNNGDEPVTAIVTVGLRDGSVVDRTATAPAGLNDEWPVPAELQTAVAYTTARTG